MANTGQVSPLVLKLQSPVTTKRQFELLMCRERYSDRIPIPIRTRIIAIGMLRDAVTVTSPDSLSLAACAGTNQAAPKRPQGSALPRFKDNKTIRVADEDAPEDYRGQQSIFLGR